MPIRFSVSGSNAQAGTSGSQTVGSSNTLVASIDTTGVGEFCINGFVTAGTLNEFILAFAAAPVNSLPANANSGGSVNRLVASAGDFAVITNLLNNATAHPDTTTAGGSFYADLDLKGRASRVDIYAKSTSTATLTIDATGVGINVG